MAPNSRVSKPVDAEAWPSLGAAPARAPKRWGPKIEAAGKPSPAPEPVQLSVVDLKVQASPAASTVTPSSLTTSPPPSEPGSDLQEQPEDEAKDGVRATEAVVRLGEYNGIPVFGAPQFETEAQPKGLSAPAAPPGNFAAAVPPGLAGEPRRTSLKDVLQAKAGAEIKLVKPTDVVPKPPPPGLDAQPAGATQRTPLKVLNGSAPKAPGQRTGLRTGAPLFVPVG